MMWEWGIMEESQSKPIIRFDGTVNIPLLIVIIGGVWTLSQSYTKIDDRVAVNASTILANRVVIDKLVENDRTMAISNATLASNQASILSVLTYIRQKDEQKNRP